MFGQKALYRASMQPARRGGRAIIMMMLNDSVHKNKPCC